MCVCVCTRREGAFVYTEGVGVYMSTKGGVSVYTEGVFVYIASCKQRVCQRTWGVHGGSVCVHQHSGVSKRPCKVPWQLSKLTHITFLFLGYLYQNYHLLKNLRYA